MVTEWRDSLLITTRLLVQKKALLMYLGRDTSGDKGIFRYRLYYNQQNDEVKLLLIFSFLSISINDKHLVNLVIQHSYRTEAE